LYGFVLTFFGGVFMTLIAATEAARLFGWDKIRVSLLQLQREGCAARLAFERDNKKDEDLNGVADINELSAQQLATRRFLVLTRSVDPDALSKAIEGLSTAGLAVVATCRVKFAYAITIGTTIGDTINNILGPWIMSALTTAVPDEYEKWIPVLCRYVSRYVGITMSWFLLRVTSSAFSAMRGGSLLVSGVTAYLVRYGHVDGTMVSRGEPALVAAWGLATIIGMYWQLSSGFRLAFPLNIVFLPVTIAERLLVGLVGVSS
jgi:hypothetical protein